MVLVLNRPLVLFKKYMTHPKILQNSPVLRNILNMPPLKRYFNFKKHNIDQMKNFEKNPQKHQTLFLILGGRETFKLFLKYFQYKYHI